MPLPLSLLRRIRRRVAHERNRLRIARTLPYTAIQTLAAPLPHDAPTAPDLRAEFDAARAFELLVRQCEFGPRIPGTAGHRATREFLVRELQKWTDEVALQEWEQYIGAGPGAGTTVPLTNIFALLRSTDERETPREQLRPALMLGAHWDTRPVADQDPVEANRTRPVPGANDGASGVAVVLELARVLQARRPRYSVLLAFFDGEDLGEYYYGSRLYARHIHQRALAPWKPARAIVLDMVGKTNLRCTRELHSQEYAPQLWEAVHAAARRCGLEAHFGGLTCRINDDHLFLNEAKIPAILLIDYTYRQWHTTSDTIEQCSPESLRVVGEVVLETLFGVST